MRNGKTRAICFSVAAFICILLLAGVMLTANRYFYGNWNPLDSPSRINCLGRRYYPEADNKVLTGKDKPTYLINVLFPGKRIYSQFPRGKYVPTVVFLHIKGDVYLVYALSGGP